MFSVMCRQYIFWFFVGHILCVACSVCVYVCVSVHACARAYAHVCKKELPQHS